MPRDPAKLIRDVVDAGAAIEMFVARRTLEDYRGDLMLRSAVERQFEIIGEAIRRLTALDPHLSSQLGSALRVIAFRNIIAHGYDILDAAIVWQVIHDDLPPLLRSARMLLEEGERRRS